MPSSDRRVCAMNAPMKSRLLGEQGKGRVIMKRAGTRIAALCLTGMLWTILAGVRTARADALIITIDNSLRIVQPNSTEIYTGTVTNNTGLALDAANDLFLNFAGFNPVFVDL